MIEKNNSLSPLLYFSIFLMKKELMAKLESTAINQLDKKEGKWFAVYTQYKREKLVKKMLDQKGIECYLPIKKVVKEWSKKRRTMEIPLISCYIFVKITASEYVPVLETEYVMKFLRIGKDLIAIPESEIELIQRILQEDTIDFEIEANQNFKEGDWVEITGGNLEGVKGKLVEIEGKNRVLITLEHIKHTFRISIEKQLIKKI
jgi:transcription antitermination factor NusG